MSMRGAWSQPQPQMRKPRYMVLAAVVLAHVAVVGAFASMRLAKPLSPDTETLQVSLYEAPATEPEVVLPPKPVMVEMPVLVPNPEVQLTLTPEPPPITVATIEQPATVVPTSAHEGPPRAITPADYLRPPATQYPPLAKKHRQQGLVVLRVMIGLDGRAMDIQIEHSSGFALLDRAARDAVREALFRPYVENGVAHNIQVLVPIEFSMAPRLARAES
jgi:protein TonB